MLFERFQRSEKALVAALAEMYAQGVPTSKVKNDYRGALRSHWVESSIGETLSFHRLPRAHYKHLLGHRLLPKVSERDWALTISRD